MRNHILLATGYKELDKRIREFEGYEFIGEIDYKREVIEKSLNLQPDILILSDYLTGKENLTEILVRLKKEEPSIRINSIT